MSDMMRFAALQGRLICPICGGMLSPREASLYCDLRHCFDGARGGYVNLLPPRGGGQHGDSREMVEARRAFLEGGYYQPLREKLQELLVKTAKKRADRDAPFFWLDAGCGEGYYTAAMAEGLSVSGIPAVSVGLDISKDAVRMACGRRRELLLLTAGVYDLPFAEGSFDGLVSVFSPLATGEFHRVLKSGGGFLAVIPAERHLWEMKEILYETPYENRMDDTEIEGFVYEGREQVETVFTLPTATLIQALFGMTPYSCRTPREGRERLLALDSLTLTASFYILRYCKR